MKITLLALLKQKKLLGIYIDKTLSWEVQIDKLCTIIVSRLSLMSRLKVYLPSNCLKLYYNSYILSVIDYYCTVWGNAS
jgi:hypothetical protein